MMRLTWVIGVMASGVLGSHTARAEMGWVQVPGLATEISVGASDYPWVRDINGYAQYLDSAADRMRFWVVRRKQRDYFVAWAGELISCRSARISVGDRNCARNGQAIVPPARVRAWPGDWMRRQYALPTWDGLRAPTTSLMPSGGNPHVSLPSTSGSFFRGLTFPAVLRSCDIPGRVSLELGPQRSERIAHRARRCAKRQSRSIADIASDVVHRRALRGSVADALGGRSDDQWHYHGLDLSGRGEVQGAISAGGLRSTSYHVRHRSTCGRRECGLALERVRRRHQRLPGVDAASRHHSAGRRDDIPDRVCWEALYDGQRGASRPEPSVDDRYQSTYLSVCRCN